MNKFKIIMFLLPALVAGKHVDQGEIRTVDEDIDAETASFLVRNGRAEDITDQLPEGTEAVDIASLKVDQLKELALAEGIDLGEAKTKAEIIAAIKAARAAA